ncbi:MAG: glucose-1-phosphate adenylyltransferase [Firmicutes bacterium]|nr:glucose-1-phosphate adenylyltransferase [Bacillota bacterium]
MAVRKKHCVAMLLAGGQGSRLGVLTKYRAKPAVPFGGKYKIIDFPLSNCANSGIDTVGVLTQYQPLELNTYIGTGAPWDLDSSTGGAFVLPPYMKATSGEWYSGTANAIYQNMYFVDRYDPELLLVLSGDHIYKMDYRRLIAFHEQHQADCTIAVMRVPMEEASRFGILNTGPDLQVVEFDEKPAHPKNDLASMGIYVFNWKKIREFLVADEKDDDSAHDFGKNVLPAMLNAGCRMFAYPFEGYWKDVGTAQSLWESNMELLEPDPAIALSDPGWRIYSRSANEPPHYIGAGAEVSASLISEGCEIYGRVENSVLFSGVTVEAGALIKDSVVMSNTLVSGGAKVERSIIDEDCRIGAGAQVGDGEKLTVLGSDVEVEEDCRVEPGDWVAPHSRIGKGGE